jgi:hypothetical protein
MFSSAPVLLFGQLLGTAFACGINLYLTVAFLGLAARFGWIEGLPTGLRGLENAIVIGSALVLVLVEFVVDKIPYVDSFWDAVHTLVRPLAAAFLAFLALSVAPLELRLTGAVFAGLIALAAHASKAGVRVILNARPRPRVTFMLSLLEDILAVVVTVTALTEPAVGLLAAVFFFIATFLFARSLWRAALLGVRASTARLRGFFGSPGWRHVTRLPRVYRSLVQPEEVGTKPTVATRAALLGIRGAGAYRNGWLLLERGRTAFLYRSRLRARRLELPIASAASVRKGILTDIVEVQAERVRFTLFLLKDGPPTDIVLADIGPQVHEPARVP